MAKLQSDIETELGANVCITAPSRLQKAGLQQVFKKRKDRSECDFEVEVVEGEVRLMQLIELSEKKATLKVNDKHKKAAVEAMIRRLLRSQAVVSVGDMSEDKIDA